MGKKDSNKRALEEAAAPAAPPAGERPKKRRRRGKAAAGEAAALVNQDELARRERQRKLRELALKLRAQGKEYKKGKARGAEGGMKGGGAADSEACGCSLHRPRTPRLTRPPP